MLDNDKFTPATFKYGSDGWPIDCNDSEFITSDITGFVSNPHDTNNNTSYEQEIFRVRVIGGWLFTTTTTVRNSKGEITQLATTATFVPEPTDSIKALHSDV